MTKIGRPSLWEEKRDEWVQLYCEQKRSRGQIAREYGTSVQSVTRQLLAAGVDLESRVGANPNAGRSPERQAEINAKVSAARKGKGTGPRVERASRACQNPRCGQQYEYVPGKTGEKFCSKSCQMSVQGQRTAEEARAAYEADPSRRCPCGEAIPYEHRHNRIFCSPEHAKQYQAKRQTDPTKYVTFTCQNEPCGKEVTRYIGQGSAKYCSNECASKHTKVKKHFTVDGTTVLDSTWEVLVWGKCGYLKVDIERFDRSKGVAWSNLGWYAPDFYVPMLDLALEVKGAEDDDDPARWEAFRATGRALAVLGNEQMKRVNVAATRTELLTWFQAMSDAQACPKNVD